MSTDNQPELLQIGPDHVAIERNGARIDLKGEAAWRIAAWHSHMLTHGPDWAATYLKGVIDGLAAANTMKLQAILEGTRAKLAESQKLIDLAKARREANRDR